MRTGIYVRVSTEDQARHGYSLSEQRAACEARARELGARSVVVYADEGVSGEVLERPGLDALRAAARRGHVDILIVRDPDRLSRKLAHQLLLADEFERAGVRVEFLDGRYESSPEGRLFFSVRSAVAEFEKEKIRDRTMRGKREKAKQGRIPDVFPLYGYRRAADGGVEIVEEESQVVREVFHLFLTTDLGMNGIARLLNERGVPTKTGRGLWSKSLIRSMLSQPAYAGVWYWGKRDCRGVRAEMQRGGKWRPRRREREEWVAVPVPAIVDAATFERAQERLAQARRLWAGQGARRDYLLSGILECGDCGNFIYGRTQRFPGGRKVRGYSCYRNQAGVRRVGCRPQKWVAAERLEQAVWETVTAWLDDPEALAREALAGDREVEALRAEIERVDRDLERVARGRENVLMVLSEGLAGVGDAARRKLEELARRERNLLQRRREIEAAVETGKRTGVEVREVLETAKELAGGLEALDAATRRGLIRLLIRRVVVCGRARDGLRVIIHAAAGGVVTTAGRVAGDD